MHDTIVKENYDGVTRRALRAWRELEGFQPVEIFVFKHGHDAVLQGFYKYKPNMSNMYISDICEVSQFIARDIHGNEFRTNGCNCGYGGEGPRGTISILEELGIKDAERIVTQNSIVYIDMKDDTPKVEASRSVFDDYVRRPMEQTFEGARVHKYGDKLVFAEQKYSKDTIGFLKFYLERVIDKVESVSFLVDKETILSYGRQIPHLPSKPIVDYPIAVRGKNGVEIWLHSYLFNTKKLEEQSIVNKVLEAINFPFLKREYTILDKVKQALSGKSIERSVTVSLEAGEIKVHPA